jgi:hypothetical protein
LFVGHQNAQARGDSGDERHRNPNATAAGGVRSLAALRTFRATLNDR